MNWSRVKSVMIAFLILVNLSLLSYIVYEEILVNKRNSQMAETVTSLLATKNIKVDEKLVFESAKTTSAESIYVDNVISDYTTFAKYALGENVSMVNPDNYKSQQGEIFFKGDYFEIKALNNNVLYKEKINKVNAQRIAENYLNILGLDTKKSEKNITLKDNIIKVSFNKRINDLPVFKIGVTLEMTQQGITSAYGSWYNESTQNPLLSQLKSVSGVLVEYMNKNSNASEISDMCLGYSMLESGTFHESVFLTPVWKITNEKGDTFYIDARENN